MAKAPKGKNGRLPGMQDAVLEDLQDAALRYAEIRDERMGLSTKESELKTQLLGLMKKHKKREYSYNGVEVSVVTESETVKVRVKPKDKEEEAA